MRYLVVAALMALATPAFALEASDVAKCFYPAPGAIGLGAEVDLAINLNSDGSISKVEVTRYSPDNDAGYDIARSAYRAVMSCAPYAGQIAGPVTVTLKVDEPRLPGGIPLPGTQ